MRNRLTRMPASQVTREDLKWLDTLVKDFKKLNWSDGGPAKTQTLVNKLPEFLAASPKTVIYAGFLETIKSLKSAIQAHTELKIALFTYTGLLSRGIKSAVIDRFRAEKQPALLLSTDSGGEGLNLQEAGGIVNFDFPWNPMRIEQRIGRVDRVGQQRPRVFVWNMITEGTIEEYVYSVLEGKLDVCSKVIGDLDSPITRLMLRNQFEDLGIGQVILSARDPADLKEKLEQMLDPDATPLALYGRKSPISL
jgi:SNF2 family DNA or RNA helicase